ncbi:MFS transporter, DHA1 family, inner membrane transport protein [Nonomuraea solani]|uniref:MFS transporter, DHA1 family, inner membrane transport protein n=1 Tax=Nonomuraea solani TaxID=1144553 RepID=A0A1H6EQX7_9ACTN|nr:MFS transporter [Nonomuraea solani]SEG99406.1 MFS transporter, DHA1 family, inner membrane transport protein [Nonomuraea solani]
MPLALFALAISAFGIGTTEFIINGLLPELARDFGVTIPAAGLLVSGYALGVAVGGPPLTMLGGRLSRKTMLVWLMVLFIAGNLLSALAPSYGVLMTGRFLAAFAHGAYFGVGSVVAADLVAPRKRASAIALMFTGLTLANVLGVPLGTWIGQASGWRSTFWVVVVIGVVGLAGVLALVPRQPRPAGGGVLRELATFRKPEVWLALVMTVFGFAPVFAIITFIAPIMTGVGGFSPGAVPVVMALFGVGLVAGNLIGGKLADRALMPSIYGSVALLTVLAVGVALFAADQVAFIITITLFGMAAFATVPPLQTRVLDTATGAPTLASAANIGAFNLGNAIGSFAAGLTIDAGLGYTAPAWTAALLGLTGLGAAGLAGLQARRLAPLLTVK